MELNNIKINATNKPIIRSIDNVPITPCGTSMMATHTVRSPTPKERILRSPRKETTELPAFILLQWDVGRANSPASCCSQSSVGNESSIHHARRRSRGEDATSRSMTRSPPAAEHGQSTRQQSVARRASLVFPLAPHSTLTPSIGGQ